MTQATVYCKKEDANRMAQALSEANIWHNGVTYRSHLVAFDLCSASTSSWPKRG